MAQNSTYKPFPLIRKFRSGSVPPTPLRASLVLSSRASLAGPAVIRNTNVRRFSIPQSTTISAQPLSAALRWSKPNASLMGSGMFMIKSNSTNPSASPQVLRSSTTKFRKRPLAQINYDPSENSSVFGLNASKAVISRKNLYDRRNSIPWKFNIITAASSKDYLLGKKSILIKPKKQESKKECSSSLLDGDFKFRDDNRKNRSSKKRDYDEELEFITPLHKDSLSNLRTRAQLAKDHLCGHKILLDRYLPLQFGPDTDVAQEVENRYGELLSRMPLMQLQKPQKEDEYFTQITPYKPASPATKDRILCNIQHISVKKSLTPKISDTRKRARSVLCKVKGDPHYFDF